MSKRKGAGSAQSNSLLNFFSASSARSSATPAKDSGHLATPKPKVATSIVPGSSRETALVIDGSSDDEVLDVKSTRVSRPVKKVRLSGDVNLPSSSKNVTLPYTVKQETVSLDLINDFWIDEDEEVVGFDEDDVLEEVDPRLALGEDSTSFSYPVWFAASNHEEDFGKDVDTCLDQGQDISSKAGTSSKKPSPLFPSKAANAFSILMSGRQENEVWKEAEVDSAKVGTKLDGERRRKAGGPSGRRLAPFFKVMQGMPIAVDAFRYGKIPGVKAYLLTHAHSDHYTNLSSNWKNGPIYCSETTANLIKYMLRVDPKWVHPLPLDVPIVIPDTEVTVTLIEANHCPGSVLYLFEGRQTVNAGDSTFKSLYIGSPKIFRYLHCGDYRASPRHVLHPAVKGKNLDLIYMDTTYLDPKHCFPPQKQVIDACAALSRRHVFGRQSNEDGSTMGSETLGGWLQPAVKAEAPEGVRGKSGMQNAERILVVVGTYSIGKERIVKAIAQALSTKVYSDARKRALLLCQDDPELHALLTSDPLEGCVHLVPLQHVNSDKIGEYLAQFKGAYTRVLGFRPTGWTFSAPNGTDPMPAITPLIARMQAQTFLPSSLTPMRNSNHKQMLYGVPYSEHSSFFELTCFALSVDWGKIIATVNVGSQVGRSKMSRWFERWELERRRRKEKGDSLIVPSRCDEYW